MLGRLASEVAKLLRGKHKPIFAPHADTGDHVVVINARGVQVTGGKETKKMYYRHSGYPGGLRQVDYATLLARRPAVAVEKAIKGMLPKNRLGRQMASKLAVYEGPDHPHQAQKPVPLRLGEVPVWEGLPGPKPPPAPRPRKKREPAPSGTMGRRPATATGAAEGTGRRGRRPTRRGPEAPRGAGRPPRGSDVQGTAGQGRAAAGSEEQDTETEES